MCKGLLGKKLGMTSLFTPDGRYIPVTVVQAGPCVVTQIKKEATDGYNALQLGMDEKKDKLVNKPLKGHFEKSGGTCFRTLREFEVESPEEFELGQQVNTDLFQVGERVDVSGKTKGRGFSGVMKRHGFAGGRMTHGSHSKRIPGSIGCSAWPAKVIRGKKMPGQYGQERKTIRNLEIIDIRPEQNLLLIKGAIPGAKNGYLEIRKRKTL
jgi:large subunit ribosomal protein L3